MTFSDYRFKSQPALGRAALITQLQRELARRNINLTGPRGTGKSCVVRALAAHDATKKLFTAIVFCDLKGRGIDGDETFYQALVQDIRGQMPLAVSTEWLDPSLESPVEEKLNTTVDDWESAGHKVLFILDGIDEPFVSLQGAWSFLCNFVERAPVTFLCTSRKRIRELCNTREKRDSLMSDRFKNPIDIQPMTLEDITAILQIAGVESSGVASALLSASGGNPSLVIALCEEAMKLADQEHLQVRHVNTATQVLVQEGVEELELIWQELDPDERDVFITAGRIGEVTPPNNGARKLRGFGLLANAGGVLKPTCRLMQDFGTGAAKGTVLLKEWFGTEASYLHSMKQVLALRLGPKADEECELVSNVRDAIESMERPDKASRAFRDIAEEAMNVIWDVESPKRTVPALKGGPPWLVRDRIWPEKPGALVELLDLVTDDRKWENPPKKANRKHFALIAHIQHAGDFKNHQNGVDMTPAFLVATLASAVELVHEMRSVGLV